LASDPDKGQVLNFFILESSLEGAVKLDPITGKLTVADKSKLDYEKVNRIDLSVKVSDNGTISLSDTAKIVISIQDVDEKPVINTSKLAIEENSGKTAGGKFSWA
jgi:hypothetical protein